MNRKPAGPDFDASVGFFPRKGPPLGIYGVVKITYDIAQTPCPIEPVPLTSDVLHPEVEPRLELGCDFWLDKLRTDVVVLGAAHSREPTSEMQVSVTVGEVERRIAVLGRRVVTRHVGRIAFSDPEAFTEMPIQWDRAYGGIDEHVPIDDPPRDPVTLARDHPGLYPRNPFGKGYVVVEPARDAEVELPNLEDPEDRLTPERLVVEDPGRWWIQPIPAVFHYAPHAIFTRYTYLGADAWFSPPDDMTLPEVRRGILPPGFRTNFQPGLAWGFYQEAAPGLVLPPPSVDTPIIVRGMHPAGAALRARLPQPPAVEIDLEGRRQSPPLHLSKLVLIPAQQKLVTTWVARTSEMHRVFLPGVHAKIPLRMRIGARNWIEYQTPKTLRQALDDAKRGGMDLSPPRPRKPRTRSDRKA